MTTEEQNIAVTVPVTKEDDLATPLPTLKRPRTEMEGKSLPEGEGEKEEKIFICTVLNAMETAEKSRPTPPFHPPLLSVSYIPEEFRATSSASTSSFVPFHELTRQRQREVEAARQTQMGAFRAMFDPVKFPAMQATYANQWILMLPPPPTTTAGSGQSLAMFPCATDEEALAECRRIFGPLPGFAFFVAPPSGDLSGSVSEERRALQALQKTIRHELVEASGKWVVEQSPEWMAENRGKFLLFYKREIPPNYIVFVQEIHATAEEARRAGLAVALHQAICIREIGSTKQFLAPACYPVTPLPK